MHMREQRSEKKNKVRGCSDTEAQAKGDTWDSAMEPCIYEQWILGSARDKTQDPAHTRQALYHSATPQPDQMICDEDVEI